MTNRKDRELMVACMEFIVRHVNDEDLIMPWLMCGVADGDIPYGNLNTEELDVEYYANIDNYKDLCELFLRIMSRANKSGGLI